MSTSSSDETSDAVSLNDMGMFNEPENFRPKPEKEHFVVYKRKGYKPDDEHGIKQIRLRLVGKSPLWGHLLWNAGKYTAEYIDEHAQELVRGKNVVEFGSASTLPSLLCCIDGARRVIATDYPDQDLLLNMEYNIEHLDFDEDVKNKVLTTEGFIWGNDTQPIRAKLMGPGGNEEDKFADFVIMSDLVFNHTEHRKLLRSCKELIRPLSDKSKPRSGGKCLVVWSPHRPRKQMIENDFNFFEIAKTEFNFDVEFVEMVHWSHPMFLEEPKETEEIRKRVYCYILHPTW